MFTHVARRASNDDIAYIIRSTFRDRYNMISVPSTLAIAKLYFAIVTFIVLSALLISQFLCCVLTCCFSLSSISIAIICFLFYLMSIAVSLMVLTDTLSSSQRICTPFHFYLHCLAACISSRFNFFSSFIFFALSTSASFTCSPQSFFSIYLAMKEFTSSRKNFFTLSTSLATLWCWWIAHIRRLTDPTLPSQSELSTRIRIKKLRSSRKKVFAPVASFVPFWKNFRGSSCLPTAFFTNISKPVTHLCIGSKVLLSYREEQLAFFARLVWDSVLRYIGHTVKSTFHRHASEVFVALAGAKTCLNLPLQYTIKQLLKQVYPTFSSIKGGQFYV